VVCGWTGPICLFVVLPPRPQSAPWDTSVRLVSSGQPLVFPEKPKPSPPPPPPVMQPITLPPQPQHLSPPRVQKDCEACRRRREALVRALKASVKVDNFSLDEAAHGQPTTTPVAVPPHAAGQVLEVPPVWQSSPQSPFSPWMNPLQHLSQAVWPVGRNQQFWAQSSYGTTGQWLSASVQPPRSPYQVNAGTVIPAIMAQALNSDLEGMVSALVTQDVYDSIAGQYLVIPQGARLF